MSNKEATPNVKLQKRTAVDGTEVWGAVGPKASLVPGSVVPIFVRKYNSVRDYTIGNVLSVSGDGIAFVQCTPVKVDRSTAPRQTVSSTLGEKLDTIANNQATFQAQSAEVFMKLLSRLEVLEGKKK